MNALPGWFNVDLHPHLQPELGVQFFLDAREPFPFADGTFDYIFSEHMIEHITYLEARTMLAECYRAMKPGSRIRIATPDLEKLARLYESPRDERQQKYIDDVISTWRLDYDSREVGVVVNNIFGFGHCFIYDRATLAETMERAGFTDLVQCQPGQSSDPNLRAIDAHSNDYISFETLVLEAAKPNHEL
jgi:predicted SAM-dependent methyltransferase